MCLKYRASVLWYLTFQAELSVDSEDVLAFGHRCWSSLFFSLGIFIDEIHMVADDRVGPITDRL